MFIDSLDAQLLPMPPSTQRTEEARRMDNTIVERNVKTINAGMRFFRAFYLLYLLLAALSIIVALASLRHGWKGWDLGAWDDRFVGGMTRGLGYAIVAAGFYYLRT